MPDALIFDFDGLICDTEVALMHAAQDLFADHGVELPVDRWLEVVGTASPVDFWVPWLEELLGRGVDRDDVLVDHRRREQERSVLLRPNDGVLALLGGAEEHGIPCAIASSSPTTWVEPFLERFGIRSRFATVVCREHAARAKPHPDLYLAAAERLGVRPERCVALEDSRNGSLAAVAAGMRCIVVPNVITASQDVDHAHLVIHSLAAIDVPKLRALLDL